MELLRITRAFTVILVLAFITMMSTVAFAGAFTTDIALTSPTGGDNWQIGSNHDIVFSYNGALFLNNAPGATVKITLEKQSGEYSMIIAKNFAIENYYGTCLFSGWTIPTTVPEGNDYKLVITSNVDANISASSSVFTISKPRLLLPLVLLGKDKLIVGNFKKTDIRGKIMINARLSGANFQDANCQSVNLSGSDLSGADFSGANLSGADLSGANLSKANLMGANLSKADLSNADLRGANLSNTNLTGANLKNAKLHGANLIGTTMKDATLTGVIW